MKVKGTSKDDGHPQANNYGKPLSPLGLKTEEQQILLLKPNGARTMKNGLFRKDSITEEHSYCQRHY